MIPLQRLIDRWRQPRSRLDDLRLLREGLAREAREAGPAERALAAELRTLRAELGAVTGRLASCATCASGCSLPAGRWDGGFCCSGETSGVFCDDEVAALAAGGTSGDDLHPPLGEHAGCAFRGPDGCTQDVVDRPNLCVVYVCREATHELHDRHALDQAERLAARLTAQYQAFVAARTERRNQALLTGGE